MIDCDTGKPYLFIKRKIQYEAKRHGTQGKSEKTAKNGRVKAVAYLRTSSAANVGADKDSREAPAPSDHGLRQGCKV